MKDTDSERRLPDCESRVCESIYFVGMQSGERGMYDRSQDRETGSEAGDIR